jgi:hypothetical protein
VGEGAADREFLVAAAQQHFEPLAIAFTLTIVPRWICQKRAGSSPFSKSFRGMRTSASEPASTTRVYLESN